MSIQIRIETPHNSLEVQGHDDQTLEMVLLSRRLPPGLFQAYRLESPGQMTPLPLTSAVTDLNGQEVVIRCLRTTDLSVVTPEAGRIGSDKAAITSIRDFSIKGDMCSENVVEIDEAQALSLVTSSVEKFLATYSAATSLVVALSGGGDSAALVSGLTQYLENSGGRKKVIAFTLALKNSPMPESLGDISKQCTRAGIEHMMLNDHEVANLLRIDASLEDLHETFKRDFGDNIDHLLGITLVTMVGRALCLKYNTNEVCFGSNREDVLAEMLYNFANGNPAQPFPVRTIGGCRFLMPLWDVPKRIIDASHPKVSMTNNLNREVINMSPQRHIYYYLAHCVDDLFSNFGLSLLTGAQKLNQSQWRETAVDKKTGLLLGEGYDDATLEKIQKALEGAMLGASGEAYTVPTPKIAEPVFMTFDRKGLNRMYDGRLEKVFTTPPDM